MSRALVYNIPAKLIDDYLSNQVIVRSAVPAEIVDCLKKIDVGSIRFAQLLSATADWSPLNNQAESLPLEIYLKNPNADYVQLYNHAGMLNTHPLRIGLPVLPGFSKAVKLAASLNFAVKLELGQPDSFLIDELIEVLDLYLHRSVVRQPIDFFHTMMLSFYNHEPCSVWEVAEEDPEVIRYITDDGEETISKRFVGVALPQGLEHFVEKFGQEMLSEKTECHDCEYFNRCSGYFKWPERTYECDGIKKLFQTLKTAANEVARDLAGHKVVEVQLPS